MNTDFILLSRKDDNRTKRCVFFIRQFRFSQKQTRHIFKGEQHKNPWKLYLGGHIGPSVEL